MHARYLWVSFCKISLLFFFNNLSTIEFSTQQTDFTDLYVTVLLFLGLIVFIGVLFLSV